MILRRKLNGTHLSFIWGHHHLHLVDDQWMIYWLLHYTWYTVLTRPNNCRNSCPWLQFLAFSLDSIPESGGGGGGGGLYHGVVPLSFLHSISLASLFASPIYMCSTQVSFTKFFSRVKILLKRYSLDHSWFGNPRKALSKWPISVH